MSGLSSVGESIRCAISSEPNRTSRVTICQELGGQGAASIADTVELVLCVFLDLFSFRTVLGPEGFDVLLALPFEDQGIYAARSFSQKCHRESAPPPSPSSSLCQGYGEGVAKGWRKGGERMAKGWRAGVYMKKDLRQVTT